MATAALMKQTPFQRATRPSHTVHVFAVTNFTYNTGKTETTCKTSAQQKINY